MKVKTNIELLVLGCLIFALLMLSSCEKEIELKLPEAELKLVVEGWIEQDSFAIVSITRNASYFDKVDTAVILNSFVKNAEVYISNSDGKSEKLELDYSNAFKNIWPHICYKGKSLKGEIGKTYHLTIYAEGDTILGKTTIPEPTTLDSLWWKPDNISNPDNDSLGFIWANYSDDPNVSKYYRFFTKRLGRDNNFIPIFGSVYTDEFFSGKEFTFYLHRGVGIITDIEALQDDKELFYFKKGDTVDIKLTSIDKEHYEFWRTIEQEVLMGGNPFMFPAVIRHNVTNAIGVFGGYSITYYRLIIGKE